jgi:NTE family protein
MSTEQSVAHRPDPHGTSTRAIILAGGGIRVAWQTGVVTALDEVGYSFSHGDGSSGGLFTLGMMLSGQPPEEMAARWRSLDVKAFVSFLPLRDYLRSPTNWLAFGGAGGVRNRVLPQLGIDLPAIRSAAAMTGSFNVADFATKSCVAIPHTEIDIDRLVAGVSLAGLMPAVEHGGRMWTDAVWIKDANLTEAVQRGCTELWIAWCIGNTPRWGTGALEQYVHMIEMSATGSLVKELQWIADINARRAAGEPVLGTTRQITVHLIKPELPIPLDPDFVAGRIDAETLIAMGYRDAHRYLRAMSPDGIALDNKATATPARPLGARIVLRSNGELGGLGTASCTLVVEADDIARLQIRPDEPIPAVGAWRDPRHGYHMFVETFVCFRGIGTDRTLVAEAELRLDGEPCRLLIEVPVPTSHWSAARTHRWTLAGPDGQAPTTGIGHMSIKQTVAALTSFEPSGAHDLRDRARVLGMAVSIARHAVGATAVSRVSGGDGVITRSG